MGPKTSGFWAGRPLSKERSEETQLHPMLGSPQRSASVRVKGLSPCASSLDAILSADLPSSSSRKAILGADSAGFQTQWGQPQLEWPQEAHPGVAGLKVSSSAPYLLLLVHTTQTLGRLGNMDLLSQ